MTTSGGRLARVALDERCEKSGSRSLWEALRYDAVAAVNR